MGARRQDSLRAPSIRPPRRSPPRPRPGRPDSARNNFIALTFVLMVGTAALPHILMRYYTTPSVREARRSVFWSLFFIFLLYVTAPAYAVFAKWEVYSNLIGTDIAACPAGWRPGARSGW
jgi:cation/acetate symporter